MTASKVRGQHVSSQSICERACAISQKDMENIYLSEVTAQVHRRRRGDLCSQTRPATINSTCERAAVYPSVGGEPRPLQLPPGEAVSASLVPGRTCSLAC